MSRWDVGPRGTLSRGSPQDAVLPTPRATQIRRRAACRAATEAQREVHSRGGTGAATRRRWRGISFQRIRCRSHAAISPKLRPRGHPRAACGPPFLLFGLRPRRNGVGFRPLRRATKGAAFGICQPFEKGWTENFSWLPYTKSPARNNRPRRGILRKPQINIWAASHRWCAGPHEPHGCRACRGTPHTAS